MQYVTKDESGNITVMAEFEFPDSVVSEKKVVVGWDGALYYEGDERVTEPSQLKTQRLSNSVRAERDRRIESTQWLVQRHLDEISAGRDTTLTPEKYQEWLEYRQALRDIPAQPGFPWNGGGEDDVDCPWPVKPE